MREKKLRNIILIALISLCAVLCFAACDKGDDVQITAVKVNLPDNVTIGEAFSDDVRVTVSYSNGDRRSYSLSAASVTGFDANKEGYQNVTVTYGDMSYTATVRVIRYYTVSYGISGEGGSLYGNTSQTLPNGDSCEAVQAIPFEGYEFDSWSDGYPNPKRRDDKAVADTTYNASFKKIFYNVSFYGFDVATRSFVDPLTENVDYGQSVTVPDFQGGELDGYTFLGYVEGKSSLAGIKTAAAVTANLIKPGVVLAPQASAAYYPVFIPRTYTVKYYDMSSSADGDLLFTREGIDYNNTVALYDDCVKLWDARCLNLNLYPDYYDMSWTAYSGDRQVTVTALDHSILSRGDVRVELRYEYVKVGLRYFDSDGKTLIAATDSSNAPRLNDLVNVYGKLNELLGLTSD